MDCTETGALIRRLRTEKGFTQKEIADRMNISDKTVSKWERGLGCPDVSLLNELSEILGVNIDRLLSGKLVNNENNGGNMKKTEFYVCPTCGSFTLSSGKAEVSCCGRKLSPLEAKPCDEKHRLEIAEMEDEYFITIPHEMSKEHYIGAVSYLSDNRCFTVKLYPEQNPEFRFPQVHGGCFYFYCVKDGLFSMRNS